MPAPTTLTPSETSMTRTPASAVNPESPCPRSFLPPGRIFTYNVALRRRSDALTTGSTCRSMGQGGPLTALVRNIDEAGKEL
jgi:hypothetical protein